MRLLAIALLIGCTHAPPAPTEAAAQRANVSIGELQAGRTALIKRCGGCHTTPLPEDHLALDWPKWVDDMRERAKLVGDERDAIVRYLVAMHP